jgi:integrase
MQLPPKVHEKHGRYYYVHKNKWHPLTSVDEGSTKLYEALQAHTNSKPITYGEVMILYIARAVPKLKPASQPEYIRIIQNRLMHAFGHMLLDTLQSSHIAKYLQAREDQGAPIGGNREKAVLGSVISWGMRFGWCGYNPCFGVRRNKETPSRVYVSDKLLRDVVDRATPALQNLLSVAFLTGLRQTDLITLKRKNIKTEGIELRQSKDGKLRMITWSPALKHFVDKALARSECDHVFVGMSGKPWSVDGLQSAMRRLAPGFRFRELRPKAASDAEHNVLGHDAQMLSRYVRAQRLKPVR